MFGTSMKRIARTILLLHGNARFRERVITAGGKEFSVKVIPNWPSLHKEVEGGNPSTIVIIDPYHGHAGADEPVMELAALLKNFPSAVVFAGLVVDSSQNTQIRQIERWGVAEIISIGHDDTSVALRSRFRQTEGLSLRRLVDEVVPADLTGRGRAILDAAAEIVTASGRALDLATALGLSERTLQRWLRRSALPPTRTLFAWMRVLLAASLLDDPGRSIEGIARICGYSSGSSLRRIAQSLLGAQPAELRRLGAFAHASRRLGETLDAYREKPAE
jgi:AraC-like DNA-binding protein